MNATRFYCPKCDLKYRIAQDKLAEQPNAQMRCRACATIFSVHAAVKLAGSRMSDEREPIDGANLSRPPPKPAPMAWKSSAPAVSSPPGKGVVTMPLLDVTARPRIDPVKQVNVKSSLTKPGLAPNTRALLGPKNGQRGLGAAPLLASRSLRATSERSSPLQVKLSLEHSAIESTRPVHVLGRGSAIGFPPVTSERTHPVVPPLPRLGKDAATETPLHVGAALQRNPAQQAAANQQSPTAFGQAEELDSEQSLESVPPTAPVSAAAYVGAEGEEAPWVEEHEVEEHEVEDHEVEEHEVEDHKYGVHRGDDTEQGALITPIAAPVEVDVLYSPSVPAPVSVDSQETSATRKRGVTWGAAVAMALTFGFVGVGAGYVLGSKQTSPVAALHAVSEPNEDRRIHAETPPPPPPPPPAAEQAFIDEEGQAHVLNSVVEASLDTANAKALTTLKAAPIAVSGEALPANVSGLDALATMVTGPAPAGRKAGTAIELGLSARELQATVHRFQPTITRACWQPALSRRGSEGSSAARVTTTVMIAPTGRVTGVDHTGDPEGFPGLASCIAARVKVWKFPRAPAATTANIPFVFAAQ